MTEQWERAKVERVHLVTGENNEPVCFSGGEWESFFGRVYQGRLKFESEGGKRRNLRVAVKVFKDQKWANNTADKFSQAMHDFRKAGIPLPKMFMHRLSEGDANGFHGKAKAGDLVKVMELYGSHKGSKLTDLDYSPETNRRIIEYSTKLANAGYSAECEDFYKMLRGKVKPFDLDLFVVFGSSLPSRVRAQGVLDHIKSLVKSGNSTHDELLKEALKHAKPKLKRKIKGLTKNPKWAEEKY